ncbi:hypothetical protein SDC9_18865 [bioreactor metagenome]|uniref:Oxidoreductase n=1 Tax=bioreactor metagenome TaxID=1076179 RepID=A0A644U3G7_9ZZZZ
MSVIVRDDGFHADDFTGEAVEIAPDTPSEELIQRASGAALVRIAFPSFADGRGFTLARRLRAAGYAGRLRAAGHVIADQYAMARRSGFDEVEISEALAERQGAEQWLVRANWRAHDYRARLQR